MILLRSVVLHFHHFLKCFLIFPSPIYKVNECQIDLMYQTEPPCLRTQVITMVAAVGTCRGSCDGRWAGTTTHSYQTNHRQTWCREGYQTLPGTSEPSKVDLIPVIMFEPFIDDIPRARLPTSEEKVQPTASESLRTLRGCQTQVLPSVLRVNTETLENFCK